MRLGNYLGRAHIVRGDLAYDLELASFGRFSPDPQAAFDSWEQLVDWESTVNWNAPAAEAVTVHPISLEAPSPRPRQVLAVGLNYRNHAAEANLDLPAAPVIFTKFASCLVGPYSDIPLPSANVDWEIELVVTMAREASRVSEAQAWSHVAGISVGQDITDRVVQHRPPIPQFSMGKSFPSFGPFGPTIVSLDEIPNPDDLELVCHINDQQVQRARTSDLIFTVPELISHLSSIVTLYPGDVIFTGTPAGVGGARNPKWFLKDGDVVTSEIVGVGSMANTCVVSPTHTEGASLTQSATR